MEKRVRPTPFLMLVKIGSASGINWGLALNLNHGGPRAPVLPPIRHQPIF